MGREIFASSGTVTLKPSLEVQMKKQEAVNKKAALVDRLKAKNVTRVSQTPKKTIGKTEIKKDLTPTLTIPPVPTTYTTPTKTETGSIETPTISIP